MLFLSAERIRSSQWPLDALDLKAKGGVLPFSLVLANGTGSTIIYNPVMVPIMTQKGGMKTVASETIKKTGL